MIIEYSEQVFGATNPSIQFNGCIVEDNTAHLGGGVMSVVSSGDWLGTVCDTVH